MYCALAWLYTIILPGVYLKRMHFNRLPRFSQADFLPAEPGTKEPIREESVLDIPGINIVKVYGAGDKIELGFDEPQELAKPQKLDEDFLLDKDKLLRLMGLNTAQEKELFKLRVVQHRQAKGLPFTIPDSKEGQLKEAFSQDDFMYIDELAMIYTQIEDAADHSFEKHSQTLFDLASVYEKDMVANAIQSLAESKELSSEKSDIYQQASSLEQAQKDLLEMLQERQGFSADNAELTPVHELEREAKHIALETELSPELIIELMGLEPGDEQDLFGSRRSAFNQIKKLGFNLNEDLNAPALIERLGKQTANYINNLGKVASDVENAEDQSFETHGPRLLKIAAHFGRKEVASKIFDALPNIYLKEDKPDSKKP